ncbi:MAG TPA: (Fe-S)-binding protein [Desulfobacterales bacterium]|nr:(Fe-S)-binding protein [Desulfobacterales bacterium]
MRSYPPKPETVYFFGTCLVDMVYPDAGMAAIRLLQREGLRVVYPRAQSCCGQPAYNSGFPDEARAVARKQLHLFPKDHPIVVPSGSCAGMMHRHYPALFAEDSDRRLAEEFAGRVFELTEFLVHVLDIRLEDRGAPVTVTWHSSCHALREMGVIQDSKSLIRQLENVTLLELENEHECCGFGGTFAVKQPEISAAMVADKAADIRQTGAAVVLGGDCGCLMNITGALQHRRVPVTGQHIAQFIWERIHG